MAAVGSNAKPHRASQVATAWQVSNDAPGAAGGHGRQFYRRTRLWGVAWRLFYRLPWLLIHLLLGLPLAVVAQFPVLRQCYWGEYTVEDRAARWWCGGLLKIFGMRVEVHGHLEHDAVLVVANHISWIDIVALLSLRMLRFVAKAEIGRWPLMGWLVTRAQTIYVERGNSDSAQQVLQTLVERLQGGHSVAIFPEGGIPEVPGVARFRSRLLQAAINTGVDVEPITLRYRLDGVIDKGPGFWPQEHFMANFLRLLGGPPLSVEIHVLPRLSSHAQERRELALSAETEIRYCYHHGSAATAAAALVTSPQAVAPSERV